MNGSTSLLTPPPPRLLLAGWRGDASEEKEKDVSFAADGKCDYCGKGNGTRRWEWGWHWVMDDGAQLRCSQYYSLLFSSFLESSAHYVVVAAAAISLLSTPGTHTGTLTHSLCLCLLHPRLVTTICCASNHLYYLLLIRQQF